MKKQELLRMTNKSELFEAINNQENEVDKDVTDYFNKLCREEWLKDHDPDIMYDPVKRTHHKL